MVESTALEMRHTRKGIVGSNPTLSAIAKLSSSRDIEQTFLTPPDCLERFADALLSVKVGRVLFFEPVQEPQLTVARTVCHCAHSNISLDLADPGLERSYHVQDILLMLLQYQAHPAPSAPRSRVNKVIPHFPRTASGSC